MVDKRKVYAIQTSTRTFIADGLAHHNCVGCNVFKNGNMDEYSLFMLSKYGEGILQEMNKKKQQIRQWTSKEMEEKIVYYSQKLEELKKNY